MMDQYTDGTLAAWLAWIHLAFMLVPLMIATIYLEWRDWAYAHPKTFRERAQPQALHRA